MYVYFNPNPEEKRTGDCVIRALSMVTGYTWEQVYIDLSIKGLLMGEWGNSNPVWEQYLRQNGFRREVIPNTCPDCYTIRDFTEDHPNGTYVACTGSHVVAVIDGIYYDAWDSGNEIPTYYFYKED